jgi:hypothetical protein
MVDRAEFVRQLYNLRDMLEGDNAKDTEAKIRQFQNKINQHNKIYPMKSFYTKDTTSMNKRKRVDGDDRGAAGGGSGGVDATDCAELGAHGYEVEPRDIVDENGQIESFSNVR